jgi:hypothetical protein
MNRQSRTNFLRDKRAQYAWLFLVLAWACFRALAINKFFGNHNVNSWGYLLVDIASSVPYAIYSARAVVNFLDKSWMVFRKNVLMTALFFYIPDFYVLIFARTVPTSLYVGFGISIIFFSTLAFSSLKKDASRTTKYL